MREHSHRRPTTLAAALAALWLGSSAGPLLAETPAEAPAAAKPKTAKEEAKEAKQKVREASKEAGETVAAAKDEAVAKIEAAKTEAKATMKAAHEEMKAKMGEAREDLRAGMHEKVDEVLGPPEDRAERARVHRRNQMHALRPHWKRGADIPPPVRAELRQHARRTARLMRIRALAEAKKDTKSVERCDKLLELENTHHQKRMERFTPKTAAAPAAPAAVPAAQAEAEAEADEKAPEERAAEDKP
jgi:hypothetical protein